MTVLLTPPVLLIVFDIPPVSSLFPDLLGYTGHFGSPFLPHLSTELVVLLVGGSFMILFDTYFSLQLLIHLFAFSFGDFVDVFDASASLHWVWFWRVFRPGKVW